MMPVNRREVQETRELAYRGLRKSVCKACQNRRYRRRGGDALKGRNRKRMQLRRRHSDPSPLEPAQQPAEIGP